MNRNYNKLERRSPSSRPRRSRSLRIYPRSLSSSSRSRSIPKARSINSVERLDREDETPLRAVGAMKYEESPTSVFLTVPLDDAVTPIKEEPFEADFDTANFSFHSISQPIFPEAVTETPPNPVEVSTDCSSFEDPPITANPEDHNKENTPITTCVVHITCASIAKLPRPEDPSSVSRTSLLDVDLTPSPAKYSRPTASASPQLPSPRRLTLCGLGDCCKGGTSPSSPEMPNVRDFGDFLQTQITDLLGSTSPINSQLNEWQAWSYQYIISNNIDPVLAPEPSSIKAVHLNADIRRVLKNRAFDLTAKKKRLQSLRRDLNAFTPLDHTHGDVRLRKIHSFNMESTLPSRQESRQPQPRSTLATGKKFTSKSKQEKITCAFPLFDNCTSPFTCGVPIHVIQEETNEDARRPFDEPPVIVLDTAYDSDPEDFTRRRSSTVSKTVKFEPDVPPPHGVSSDPSEQDSILKLVREFTNENLIMVLHDDTRMKVEEKNAAFPLALHVWIDLGQKLSNRIIMPKLSWKAWDTTVDSDCSNKISSVDLLDIHRVLPVDKPNRKDHPFAKTGCCLVIKSAEHSFLLETASKKERDRVVHALKCLVATFGSKLATADHRMIECFFALEYDQGMPVNWVR